MRSIIGVTSGLSQEDLRNVLQITYFAFFEGEEDKLASGSIHPMMLIISLLLYLDRRNNAAIL
jgi:hypothetical protein